MKILLNAKFQNIVAVATFKMLVATCGDWRQGWTWTNADLEQLIFSSFFCKPKLFGKI